MPWHPLNPPTLSQTLGQAGQQADTFGSGLNDLTAPLRTALSLTESLQETTTDPLQTAVQATRRTLENLIGDVGATGIYQLISTPQALPAPNGWQNFIEGIVNSFNDLGDPQRPQFSADASCGGLIFIAGSASLEGFKEALEALAALFDLVDFLEGLEVFIEPEDDPSEPPPASQYPNWESSPLREIPLIGQAEQGMASLMGALGATAAQGQSAGQGFLARVENRITAIAQASENLQALTENFGNDLNRAGIYKLAIPEAVGGVKYYQNQILDSPSPGFSNLSYLAGVVLCGGTGSMSALQRIF